MKYFKYIPWVLALAVLVTYAELFWLYFSLDEWGVIGYAHVNSWLTALRPTSGWFPIGSLMALPLGTVLAPESAIVWSSLIVLFHFANVYLLYLLVRKLSDSTYLALATAVLFAVSPVGSEMLRYLAMLGSVIGFTLMLGALNAAVSRRYAISIILLTIGLLTNSYSPTLAPPLLVLLVASGYMGKPSVKSKRNGWIYGLLGLVFIVGFLLYEKSLSVIPGGAVSLQSGSSLFLERMKSALITSPLIVLPQLFWYFKGTLELSTISIYSNVILSLSAIWLIILGFGRKKHPENIRTILLIVLSFLWMYCAYVYFSVIRQPVLDAAVSSRYLYASSMGAALLVGTLLWQLSQVKVVPKTFMVVSIVALVMLSLISVGKTRFLVHDDVTTGQVRRRILSTVKTYQPTIPPKAIIFMNTDFGAHTIHANLGYILSLLYVDNNEAYRKVAADSELFNNSTREWYASSGDNGLGYVNSYESLVSQMKQYQVPSESIFAFSYDKHKDLTKNTTSRLRELLTVLGQPKTALTNQSQWSVMTVQSGQTVNPAESAAVLDQDPRSGITIDQRSGSYIQLDLGRVEKDLTQINLQTGDGNSYPRSYTVEGSVNGETWDTLVEEEYALAGVYTTIPFKARDLRFIRVTNTLITPIFFQWSVSGLTLFQLDR